MTFGITIEDLKESKVEIVEQIKQYTTNVKGVMEMMVIMMDDYTCIRQLVLGAVDACGSFKVSDNTEHYIAESLKQRGSSLR